LFYTDAMGNTLAATRLSAHSKPIAMAIDELPVRSA
jgi:hypothetical protein